MGLLLIARRPLVLAAAAAEPDKVRQDAMQKEPEPSAFSASFLADAVHPVVPIAGAEKREPMRSCRRATIDRSGAMLEQRA